MGGMPVEFNGLKPGQRSKIHWRWIGLILAVVILISILILAGYIAWFSARAATGTVHPPLLPITQSPAALGIANVKDVSLTTEDQVHLKAWYVTPQPGNGVVILLLHGYASNRQMLLPEAGMLTRHGFGVLMLDFRGHGESDPARVTLGGDEQRDITAALDWLSGRSEVKRIAALGFSMGASTLALSAARDERISSVVIEAAFPTLDAEIWFRSRIFGWLSQVPAVLASRSAGLDLEHVRPKDALCEISPRPVLLIYGQLDGYVPPGTAQEMQSAACANSELWLIPGASHQNYSDVIPAEYERRLIAWFEK